MTGGYRLLPWRRNEFGVGAGGRLTLKPVFQRQEKTQTRKDRSALTHYRPLQIPVHKCIFAFPRRHSRVLQSGHISSRGFQCHCSTVSRFPFPRFQSPRAITRRYIWFLVLIIAYKRKLLYETENVHTVLLFVVGTVCNANLC